MKNIKIVVFTCLVVSCFASYGGEGGDKQLTLLYQEQQDVTEFIKSINDLLVSWNNQNISERRSGSDIMNDLLLGCRDKELTKKVKEHYAQSENIWIKSLLKASQDLVKKIDKNQKLSLMYSASKEENATLKDGLEEALSKSAAATKQADEANERTQKTDILLWQYKVGAMLLLAIISFLLADKYCHIGSMVNLQFS